MRRKIERQAIPAATVTIEAELLLWVLGDLSAAEKQQLDANDDRCMPSAPWDTGRRFARAIDSICRDRAARAGYKGGQR